MKKGLNSSLLGQTRISVNVSRHSDHSRINDSRINTSFDLLENSLIDTSLEHPLLNQPTSFRSHIIDRRQKQKKPERLKKNYLTKVLMNRMINVRLAIKAMEDVPRALFKKGPSLDIAEALTLKTKITLETSLLRTLLYSSESKKKEESKFSLQRGYNTFVSPTPSNNYLQEQFALITLNELFKSTIRACIRKFKQNLENKIALSRYFGKMCSNFQQSRATAFKMFKFLPGKAKNTGIDAKTLALNRLAFTMEKIANNSSRLKSEVFSFLKVQANRIKLGQEYGAKTIVLYSKLRKEQAFKLWAKTSYDCREEEKKKAVIAEQKLQAVRRIVQRNYMKLLMEVIRRISTIQKVAVRLGCYSKINEQKALWRLFVHATKSSNKW